MLIEMVVWIYREMNCETVYFLCVTNIYFFLNGWYCNCNWSYRYIVRVKLSLLVE